MKYLKKIFMPEISPYIMKKIDEENLRTAHHTTFFIAIMEIGVLVLSMFREKNQVRNVWNAIFCCVACVIMHILTSKKQSQKYNSAVTEMIIWIFYSIMILWSLIVSEYNYSVGSQLNTFYIVILCFVGFFYLRPVIGIPMILISYGLLYAVLYKVDGAKHIVILNYILFALLSAGVLVKKSDSKITELHHEEQEANLNRELKHLSYFDMLTDMQNRRAFDVNCSSYLEKEIIIVMCDVNNFKQVNDTYGHAVGDEALKIVSGCIKEEITSDGCYRYGGDEFLLILTNIDFAQAQEKILSLKKSLPVIPSTNFKLTVSTGLAEGIPHDINELNSIMKQADNMLYIEKDKFHHRQKS